jgi:hypothetical protein
MLQMVTNRLLTIGWFSLLSLCIVPTHTYAGTGVDLHSSQLSATRKALSITGVTATLLLIGSENARAIATTATLGSAITCLQLLQKLPFSKTMKQKIQEEIDCLEELDIYLFYRWLTKACHECRTDTNTTDAISLTIVWLCLCLQIIDPSLSSGLSHFKFLSAVD